MQRSFQVGLPLLVIQLFQEGLGNIPAVTMAVFGFNVYLFVFPAADSATACVSLQTVYKSKEWRRLFLSPLYHLDDWHLYVNMVSFLWKGNQLERRLGAGWFLYLLSVFSLLTGLVYLLLQALMLKTIQRFDRIVEVIDLLSHSSECAVGFSGVLFALKVVCNHFNPNDVTYMLHIRVSNRFASWVELVLIYLIAPGTSLVGHLAGILVGLLYTVGPLKLIMNTCAELVSSAGNHHPPTSTHNPSGFRRRERDHPEDNSTQDMSDYSEYSDYYAVGLTEEEQIETAIRNSLKDQQKTKQKETGRSPEKKNENRQELSRKRRKDEEERKKKTVTIE